MELLSIPIKPNIKAFGKMGINQVLALSLFLTASDFLDNFYLAIKILIHQAYLLDMKNQRSKHGVKMDF
jgi:hypothetical protein